MIRCGGARPARRAGADHGLRRLGRPGPPRAPGLWTCAAAGRSRTWSARRASSASPGPTCPARWTSRAPDHRCRPAGAGRRKDVATLTVRERLRIAARRSGGRRSCPGRARRRRRSAPGACSPACAPTAAAATRVAIRHHYDVSNRFYEWVLGPSMAYTCAVYPHEQASLERGAGGEVRPGLPQARPAARACGCSTSGAAGAAWCATRREHYGVQALGVTLSRQQAEWAQKAVADDGLTDLVEVRHADYRDVPEGGFDAISSIGLTEHIGVAQLPAYAAPPRRPPAPRGPAAQPLHHPPQRRRAADRPARLHHRGTSSRTASCPR